VTPGALASGIDAHQHYWHLARGDYAWLTPALGAIHCDFGPADLAPHLAAAGIAETVLVQAAPTAAETAYLLALAARTPSVCGVVGWVDLAAPDAAERLRALRRERRLVGIRPMLQDIADTDWVLRPAVLAALGVACEVGLVFDALIQPRHLAAIAALVAALPDLAIVIDHAAKPAIARWRPGDADFATWRDALARLARAPRIACKLSGLATEAAADWQPADLAPYVEVLVSTFGPERLMFGSDWPVVNLAGGFARWHAAARTLTAGLPEAARAAIFGGTAQRVYGLSAA
jgi:L-fuconolactonase